MMSLLPFLFNIVPDVLAIANRQEKEIKGTNWTGRSKTVTICWYMIHIGYPNVSTKKVLELINEFTKVAEYKINIQISVVFLYMNNELSEREIKEIILATVISKRIKYLRINLTKDTEDLYSENSKTPMKNLKMI